MLRLLSKTGGVTDGIHGNVCASYEFRDLQNQTNNFLSAARHRKHWRDLEHGSFYVCYCEA